MSRPAPPPVPSHAAFLRSQIRSSLAHLQATDELDQGSFEQIESILSSGRAVSSSLERQGEDADGEGMGEADAAKKLSADKSKDKDWLRHALVETSLIPSTVDWALSIAVPSAILGDTQREAIVELVTLSQKKIALAITDPALQNKTKSATFASAKEAHAGIRKGWNAAGQSFDGIGKKRAEMRRKAEVKKAEKQEQKEIKRELRREREEIAKKRQQNLLSEPSALGSEGGKESAAAVEGSKEGTNREKSQTPPPPRNPSYMSAPSRPADTDVDGEAMVSVSCAEINSQGNVAATTIFSPWPGLLLTSTLVASNDMDDSDEIGDDDEEEGPEREARRADAFNLSEANVQNMKDRNDAAAKGATLPPPPRRAVPPSMDRSAGSNLGTSQAQSSQERQDSPSSNLERATPPTSEAVDVTEAKQRSWTKKLGL